MRIRADRIALAMLAAILPAGCGQVVKRLPATGRPPTLSEMSRSEVADVQVALGRSLEGRGEFEASATAYEAALERDADRADALLRLAVLKDRQGRFDESADLYRRALEASPGDPEVFADRGYSLYLQRRWGEAEMNLRQAIALRPDDARAHNNLALVLARNDRLDEALAEFRRGGCSPSDAHLNLAFILTTEDRLLEARRHCLLALESEPSSTIATERLGELDGLIARIGPPSAPFPADRDSQAIPASTHPKPPETGSRAGESN